MKKFTLFRNLLVGITCASALTVLHAEAQPKFNIIPTTQTSVTVPVNGVGTVSYTVTNMTKISRTLVMKPIQGITQEPAQAPTTCANPFTLAPQQSCTLTLSLDGSTLPRVYKGGPVICKTQNASNNSPDPFLCSEPALADILDIEVAHQALSAIPSTLSLLAGSYVSQSIKVTSNLLVRTALNVSADFTGTALEGNVTQDASNCLRLDPGQSCTLVFTPQLQAVTLTDFPIQGTNTNPIGASIEVVNPSSAPITIAPQQLSLQATTGSPVAQSIVVTNTSNVLTATGITATLASNLSSAGVTVTDNGGCASLAPGASTCAITFTPGTLPTTSAISGAAAIKGTNTSQVNATINVLPTTTATIAFNTGSLTTLALQVSGTISGNMTIKNNSTTEVAQRVKASFANTALNGKLTVNYTVTGQPVSTAACPNIPVGGTCLLAYTVIANQTGALATGFTISGTNTTALTPSSSPAPTISIGPFAYVANNGTGVNTISQCPINPTSTASATAFGTCGNSGTTTAGLPSSPAAVLNGTNMFFTDNTANVVRVCPINTNGSLGTCTDATTALNAPVGLAINGSFMYVANSGAGQLLACPFTNATTLGTCGTALTFPGVTAVAFVSSSTSYVAWYGTIYGHIGSGLSFCEAINSTNGAISSCQGGDSVVYNNISLPVALAYYNGTTKFLYVVNGSAGTKPNTVAVCATKTTGSGIPSTTSCTSTGINSDGTAFAFNTPTAIQINSAQNVAYITNSGTTGTNANTVSRCSISSGGASQPAAGTLTCATTGSGFSSPGGIAF